MKILTWNIEHGGSSRIDDILQTLVNHNPDLIVLTEFRAVNEIQIRDRLKNAGWYFQLSSNPEAKTNGIFIACKEPIELYEIEQNRLPNAQHRWLNVLVPRLGLYILGVHIPGATDKWGKEDFWKAVVQYAGDRIDTQSIIIGDFNTGLKIDSEGTPFALRKYMEKLANIGWIDAWRMKHPLERDFTWFSRVGNGFRLDYAFITPLLMDNLHVADHSHEERVKNYSDHSSLIIELLTENDQISTGESTHDGQV